MGRCSARVLFQNTIDRLRREIGVDPRLPPSAGRCVVGLAAALTASFSHQRTHVCFGRRAVKLPWAEPSSRFTALFEALAITWLKAASQKAVAGLLRLSWDEMHGIMERAVKRGLERRDYLLRTAERN